MFVINASCSRGILLAMVTYTCLSFANAIVYILCFSLPLSKYFIIASTRSGNRVILWTGNISKDWRDWYLATGSASNFFKVTENSGFFDLVGRNQICVLFRIEPYAVFVQ